MFAHAAFSLLSIITATSAIAGTVTQEAEAPGGCIARHCYDAEPYKYMPLGEGAYALAGELDLEQRYPPDGRPRASRSRTVNIKIDIPTDVIGTMESSMCQLSISRFYFGPAGQGIPVADQSGIGVSNVRTLTNFFSRNKITILADVVIYAGGEEVDVQALEYFCITSPHPALGDEEAE